MGLVGFCWGRRDVFGGSVVEIRRFEIEGVKQVGEIVIQWTMRSRST
jgi:hypothetical protein